MKITKTKKTLLRALLASYNSYIKNKKGWTPKEVQPFLFINHLHYKKNNPFLGRKESLTINLFTLICIPIKPPHHMC